MRLEGADGSRCSTTPLVFGTNVRTFCSTRVGPWLVMIKQTPKGRGTMTATDDPNTSPLAGPPPGSYSTGPYPPSAHPQGPRDPGAGLFSVGLGGRPWSSQPPPPKRRHKVLAAFARASCCS